MYRFAADPPFDGILAGCLSDYVGYGFAEAPDGGVELACRSEVEAKLFEFGVESTLDRASSANRPTLIAVGGENQGPALLGAPLQNALPHAHLIQYEQLDQLGPFQDPSAVALDVIAHAATARAKVKPSDDHHS